MQIVDEIITIAELERGTFALEVANVDLGPLVRHAVDEVSRSYPRVAMTAQVPDTFHAIADGARIGGVVRELLDNACRYSPAGQPVELLARTLDEGVVVTVTDRGEGLDRSIANQAFDQPFSTGEPTLRKEKSGGGSVCTWHARSSSSMAVSCGQIRCPEGAPASRSASRSG